MLQTDRRSTKSGGIFLPRSGTGAETVPLPADAVVDPRIGGHGPTLLSLADGSVVRGISFGATTGGGGDLVVNTAQTGYQEICTDPSYAGQIVVMTYPLIGNYGRLERDDQSSRPWLPGLVVGHATAAVLEPARQLVALLRDAGVPAIAGVDTRRAGAAACARRARSARGSAHPARPTLNAAAADAAAVPRWEDQDFVGQVSVVEPYEIGPAGGPLVAVVDYGLKQNIVRQLVARGARVRVLPHTVRPPNWLSPPTWTAWSSRPGPAIRRDWTGRWPGAGGHRRRAAAAGHLPGSPDRRPRRRRRHAPPALRPPRREPPGQGPRHRPRPGHGAEPRGRGGRRDAAARRRLHGQPAQPQRRLGRGPAPSQPSRSRPSSTTPRARPARSTRSRCSTASWPAVRTRAA